MFSIKQMSPQLRVVNIERAIDFYTTNLGFELDFRYEDFYAGIIKDGYSIHLKLVDEPVERKQDESLDITFTIGNIQALYDELLNRDVNIIQPLRQMPYATEFYIADPDGNVIAFIEIGN